MEAEMSLRIAAARELIALKRRHGKYTGTQYINYCNQIRDLTQQLGERRVQIKDVVSFFEKKFVEEMEVLARICSRVFASELEQIQVEYVRNDPPDGIITLPNQEQIFIECTSAKDSRWEAFVLEQLRLHGRIVSLSGFDGTDILGSRNTGYTVKGLKVDDPETAEYLCEADEEIETIERHRRHIIEKLEKKLSVEWQRRRNWLSIYVNEYVIVGGSYITMEPTLSELFEKYREKLRSKNIEALIFISNKTSETGWFSIYRT
ncbi:MAG: hypothetical protein C0473_00885 [Cyanobacteria bacterium DS3.002]|nr:hypothetical protein [Cyanobacteria bacterium DS3.002]MBA4049502.1 hypothetical protein [Cyanobacteria bacterium DS2.008]MBA4074219.1 hypothetical protein [Cyanobacteria bacterium PR.023]